ncbi:MAG TPA: hypothetical protein VFC47_12030 [Caulobacteraceae bacterium]|nr:hypothetical protein [Caulobacteraceae bacterium]
MAEIEIGDAVASGFGLIRREPLAVLLWGLVYLVAMGVAFAAMGPVYAGLMTRMASHAASAGATPLDMRAMMGQMAQVQGVGMLVNILIGVVGMMIYCAVFRAILHPEQKRFGYLRLGMAELFIFILGFAANIVLVFALLIPLLVIGLIAGILAASHSVAGAIIVAVVGGLAIFLALIYFALRFSLVGPMIVDDGRFHLFESWTLTKGRTVSLFVIGLSLIIILVVIEAIVGTIIVVVGVGVLGSVAGGLENLPAFFRQPPQDLLSKLTPVIAIVALAWTPLVGCAMAIFAAPWARAYRDLVGPSVAAEFG